MTPQRREANRLAAERSRHRRAERANILEIMAKGLANENEQLKERVRGLVALGLAPRAAAAATTSSSSSLGALDDLKGGNVHKEDDDDEDMLGGGRRGATKAEESMDGDAGRGGGGGAGGRPTTPNHGESSPRTSSSLSTTTTTTTANTNRVRGARGAAAAGGGDAAEGDDDEGEALNELADVAAQKASTLTAARASDERQLKDKSQPPPAMTTTTMPSLPCSLNQEMEDHYRAEIERLRGELQHGNESQVVEDESQLQQQPPPSSMDVPALREIALALRDELNDLNARNESLRAELFEVEVEEAREAFVAANEDEDDDEVGEDRRKAVRRNREMVENALIDVKKHVNLMISVSPPTPNEFSDDRVV